ncbi:methyltransferase domain-containing protein [Candidatus Dependentiae bacterium]|nr:methyltransferase domain-containing protein [Candidatus Dependentiae bacterium]
MSLLQNEYSASFEGWDFSYLTKSGRMEESPLPWHYKQMINQYIPKSKVLLDMGTGGGEFLSSLDNLPLKVFATEGYESNIEIARNCLAPKGIEVKPIAEDNLLPFQDNFFDLIINRHEAYSVFELNRVLKPNGIFITQQVGGMNDIDINSMLGAPLPKYFDWCLLKTIEDLIENGLTVTASDEYIGKTRFYDIGAIVYYLKCIPWQIEDFSIKKYFSRLKLLSDHIYKKGFIDFIYHRFYIIASKY